jgi:hypothetical protein
MKVKFSANEIIALLISALVLGVVFGFDDGRETFNLEWWFSNYISMVFLSLIMLSVFVGAQKAIAARYGCTVEYNMWKFRRFGFAKSEYLHGLGEKREQQNGKIGIPLGIILPLLIAFLSEGKAFFVVTGMAVVAAKAAHRLGRHFVHATEMETAKITAAGPLACGTVMLILKSVGSAEVFVQNGIVISMTMAVANMLPLPKIAGGTIFFASKFFYVFSLVFILVAAIVAWFISAQLAVIIALVTAILVVIFTYYYMEMT